MVEQLDRVKIAVLASGSGTTAEALIHATQDGRVPNAEVDFVVCNNPRGEVGIWDRIDRLNEQYGLDIETVLINSTTHPLGKTERGQTLQESEAIAEYAINRDIGLIACLGYMKPIHGALIEDFGYLRRYGDRTESVRMFNTHPGPLPLTKDAHGSEPSRMVLEAGLPESHHTVHWVAEEIDGGPIIAANPVEVLEGDTPDTLFARVQIVEKAALPYIVRILAARSIQS